MSEGVRVCMSVFVAVHAADVTDACMMYTCVYFVPTCVYGV